MRFSTLPSRAALGLLSSLLLLSAPSWAQGPAPTGTLIKRTSSSGADPSRDGASGGKMQVDANGNMYVTGDFHGTLDLGGITLSSPDSYDSYLAKYSPTGVLLWAQHLNGANYETVEPTVALDAAGNAYLTGSFYGALSIGGTTLTDPMYTASGFNLNGYVAKFNAQGVLQWTQRLGAAANSASGSGGGQDLVVDASGNLVLAAWFSGTVVLGNATLSSTTVVDQTGAAYSTQDILLAKLDPQGNVVWARKDGGQQDEDAKSLAVDPAGNIYLGGYFNSTTTFGAITLTGNFNNEDGFVTKYNAAGTPQWASRMPAAITDLGDDMVSSVSVDGSGNVNVLGNVEDPLLPSTGDGYRAVVTRFSPQGTVAWSKLSTGAGDTYEGNILTDTDGNLYLCGVFVGSFTLDNLTLAAPAGEEANLYIIALTPQGNLRWSLQNSSGEMSAYALALNKVGQLYVSGTVEGAATFAGLQLPATGANYESYVARLTNVVTSTRPSQALAALALYPNPTKSAATVTLPAQLGAGRVVVRDLTGRLVQQLPFAAAATQVPLTLSHVSAGLYTVQVVTETGFSPLTRLVVE